MLLYILIRFYPKTVQHDKTGVPSFYFGKTHINMLNIIAF
jgi:hypothetical protein